MTLNKIKHFSMSYVIIQYDTWCGGLGDRIVGLVSAVILARALNRNLLIKWDYPDIRNVFDLGSFNYYSSRPSLSNAVHLDTIDNRFKYEKQLSQNNIIQEWKGRQVVLKCNQDIAFFLYQNPHINHLGSYSTDLSQIYRTIFSNYLRPKQSSTLSSISRPYIGVQLRTGDAYMGVGDHRPVHDLQKVLQQIVNKIQTQTSSKTIYFTTDHPNAKDSLSSMLGLSYTVHSTPSSRIHLERSKTNSDQLRALIMDLLTLSQSDVLIISTYSNFGRLAALMAPLGVPIFGFSPPTFQITPLSVNSLFTKHPSNISGMANISTPVHTRSKGRPLMMPRSNNHLFSLNKKIIHPSPTTGPKRIQQTYKNVSLVGRFNNNNRTGVVRRDVRIGAVTRIHSQTHKLTQIKRLSRNSVNHRARSNVGMGRNINRNTMSRNMSRNTSRNGRKLLARRARPFHSKVFRR